MTEHDDTPRDPALSHRYREACDARDMAPPPAIDARILAAAREAVKPPAAAPRVELRAWWQRLTLPIGVVATTLLAVMLSLTVQRQTPDTVAPAQTEKPAPTADVVPGDSSLQNRAAPATTRADSVPSIPPAPAERMSRAAEKKVIPEPAAAAVASPPAASPGAGTPPPVSAVSNETPSSRLKAEASADRAREAEAITPLQKAAPAPAAAPDRMEAVRGDVSSSIPAWLEEIRALRRQGREEEAMRRLAEFRKAYPGYLLPEDLR